MERSSFDQELVVEPSSRSKSREPAKKRRWQEIEAIKERKRLQEELQQLDCTFDLEEMSAELEL